MMQGYLTYTLAAVAVAWGVTGYLAHWIDGVTAMNVIWAGLAAFGIRRAIQ